MRWTSSTILYAFVIHQSRGSLYVLERYYLNVLNIDASLSTDCHSLVSGDRDDDEVR